MMSTIVTIKMEDWDWEMYEHKCACGHELYLHGFTFVHNDYDEYTSLRASQCTKCGYDEGSGTFLCEGFR